MSQRASDRLRWSREVHRRRRTRWRAAIVRRIGFLPGHLILGSASDTVVVHLEPLSGSLPSVGARGFQACPQTDSPEARQLWREVASRYLTPSTQGRQANVEERRATVAEDQVGSVSTGSPRTGWRLYTLGGMTGARASMAQRGYIRPLSGSHIYDDFGIWRYPPLHAELAGHFVDSLFGEAHTLTLSRADSRNLVLRFCARRRRRDGLDGVMRVDASGSLSDARWTYWNPARDAEDPPAVRSSLLRSRSRATPRCSRRAAFISATPTLETLPTELAGALPPGSFSRTV